MGISILIECSPHAVILYLDPSSGGILLQVLFGGIAGIAVIVKLFWYRLGSIFRWRPGARSPEPGPEPGLNEVERDSQETGQ